MEKRMYVAQGMRDDEWMDSGCMENKYDAAVCSIFATRTMRTPKTWKSGSRQHAPESFLTMSWLPISMEYTPKQALPVGSTIATCSKMQGYEICGVHSSGTEDRPMLPKWGKLLTTLYEILEFRLVNSFIGKFSRY